MKTTDSFLVTLGVVPGYRHENQIEDDPVSAVAAAWDQAADDEAESGGLYVPAVLGLSRTVYRRAWGCPDGGELTVTIQGLRNPEFDTDSRVWRDSVTNIVQAVQMTLGQSTALLGFAEVEWFYFHTAANGE